MDELFVALKQMDKGHSLDLDGVIVKFFIYYWDLISNEYIAMLQTSIIKGRFPQGMTFGLITLVFKDGDRANLSNWYLITFLNVSYKILAKTLQVRLQSLLQDVISPNQLAFLPLKYILDNVLLQYETIQWMKESQQDLIYLKFDFTKAYDIVSWDFLFCVMGKIGILDSFTHIVQMLL